MELCEFLAWQAVVARKQGDEPRARRLQITANTTMSRIQMPPNREYPDAIVLFHDTGTPSTSDLIAYIDTGVTGLPFIPSGADEEIVVPGGGWITLVS